MEPKALHLKKLLICILFSEPGKNYLKNLKNYLKNFLYIYGQWE